jgi:carboxymethylenebutenolidase
MSRHALWAAAALVLGACTAGRPAEVAREPASRGAMSEKEFQALHAPGATPRLKGAQVQVAGTQMYLSLPPGAQAPLPGVLVLHDARGLSAPMFHWADRLAAEGYAALAVDLYQGKVPVTPEQIASAMRKLDPEHAEKVLHAAHAFLRTNEWVRAPRTGAISWSEGGTWVLRLAATEPELDAVVEYYAQPLPPFEELVMIRAPLLGLHGTKEPSVSTASVDELEQALEVANVPHRVLRYDAEHGFADPNDPRYNAWAAAAAWQEADAFLEKHLKR